MDHHPDKRAKPKIGKSFLAGDIPLLHERSVECPYCGETFNISVDGSAGNQTYYEDCEICCRPILFHSEVDSDGNLVRLDIAREDD